MKTIGKTYTADEFERLLELPENQDRLLELIDGRIVEKMPTEQHGVIVVNLCSALLGFTKDHQIKGRVTPHVRHRIPKDLENSRLPDISFRAGAKPLVKKGSIPQMPDLAVEIKSPDDSWKKLRAKARYYLENGTKLVWLINPERQFVEIYTAEEESVLFADDLLTGGTVLPKFKLPVRTIFEDPAGGGEPSRRSR